MLFLNVVRDCSMKLAEYQQILLTALHEQGSVKLPFSISHDAAVTAEIRLNVYRNSMLGGRLAALKQVFPCVVKLVGDTCFQQLGEQFILQNPSVNIAVNAMGEEFVGFLGTLNLMEEVPYLVDMAHFEWLWHQVFHSVANSEINYEKLSTTIAVEGEAIVLQKALGLECLESVYHLDKLWEMCQPEYQDDFRLTEEGSIKYFALVQREQRIHIETLSFSQWHLLQLLDKPETLATLCTNFAQAEDVLLFNQVLPVLYAKGLILVGNAV